MARFDTAYAAKVLTKTAVPYRSALVAVGGDKINSNFSQSTDGQTLSAILPADQDSDVSLVVSTGESDGDLDYVNLTENSPMSPANKPDLAGQISKLEDIHEVAESELVELAQPTVTFSRIDKIKLPELDNAETNQPINLQDNVATPPVLTQPYLPHSPLEDASVSPAAYPPRPLVKARNASLQAREGNLPDVRRLGANYILCGV